MTEAIVPSLRSLPRGGSGHSAGDAWQGHRLIGAGLRSLDRPGHFSAAAWSKDNMRKGSRRAPKTGSNRCLSD